MDLTVLVASLLAGAAVLLVSYGAWSLVTAERERISLRVSRTGIGFGARQTTAADLRLPDREHVVFTPVDRALANYSWAEKTRNQLRKAGMSLYISEFIALRVVAALGVAGLILIVAISQSSLLIGILSIFAGLFVWWQVGASVRRRVARRHREIEAHLDDALINISGSLRAGFSFAQACQMALPQLRWPLDEEIGEMLEQINIGASLDDALRELAVRVESYEVDIAVNAVLVQRQVGGSLAEVLDNIAATIRERRELRGHLMALTAQQRLSAYFVASVPIFMLGLLSLTSWQFMKPLFVTTTGNVLMVIGLLLDMMGFLLMKRLTRIDY